MQYSPAEIMQYIREEDVKFIRLAFCDVYGRQKNISIMPHEVERAFAHGIAFDASAIAGFGGEIRSDLFLHPDPSTIAVLPWRPEHGRVVRMFCDISYPDGSSFEADTRAILKRAAAGAEREGYRFFFGSELEFYLFNRDESGNPTRDPYDHAGYMDIAPEDRGENVRREICLALEQMGILPESSHHEEGPGQNEIDFRYSDPLSAADNTVTFRAVVNTIAARSGLCADFSPKPLPDCPGNGMHVNISAKGGSGDPLPHLIAGILGRISEMTVFLNPSPDSYARLGIGKAPRYITWSGENRSQLIRVPAASGEYRRAELRSPDPLCNPYLAFALLIEAGMEGIRERAELPPPADRNLFRAPPETLSGYQLLPGTLEEAAQAALHSGFVKNCLPEAVIESYCRR